ncbi:MAG: YncE family protein [Bacillota bacterium]
MKRFTSFLSKVLILTFLCTILIVQNSFAMTDIALDFIPADSVPHPTKPVAYLTDKVNKQLHAVNYETGEKTSITFGLPPESLTFANNEIYVCLLKAEHNFYIPDENQSGAIAVIDPDTFTLKEQFEINLDPFDIAVDTDGYIYIASGSGQWTKMKSYIRQPKRESASTGIRTRCYSELHPTMDRIYTITTDTSPRDYRAYNISNGLFTDPAYPGGYDSPYHGDYPLYKNFRISPDGKYLFNGSGVIFKTDQDKTKDMIYHAKISKSFSDIAFDLGNNRFFIGTSVGYIYTYDYNTLGMKSVYFNKLNITGLHYKNDKLVCVAKNSMGGCYVDTLTASTSSLSLSKRTALNFVPADSFIHPAKPVIYLTDKANKKLYAVDYETGLVASMTFGLMTESLTFANNELYVCLLKAEHNFYIPETSQSGAVAVVNPDSFTLKEQFDINLDPFDIAAGRDGYIYIASGSGQWTKMKSYIRQPNREISSTGIRTRSYAELNPAMNRIYTITTDTSPRDYTAYNISKGLFTDPAYPGGYDSPYHGDYPLNKNFRISPDGKYLFNGSGVIFKTDQDRAKDMMYYAKLGYQFADIAFDLGSGRFFIGTSAGMIYSYDYNTLQAIDTYDSKGSIINIYYKDSKLIIIYKASTGNYFIETLDITTF